MTILGAGVDWVWLEFEAAPADLDSFAEEVYRFCPDVVDQTTQRLAETIRESKMLWLWWD